MSRNASTARAMRPPWRTTQSAQSTPKTVLSVVATAATIRLSRSACNASGDVTASQALPSPGSSARQTTVATGKTISSAR